MNLSVQDTDPGATDATITDPVTASTRMRCPSASLLRASYAQMPCGPGVDRDTERVGAGDLREASETVADEREPPLCTYRVPDPFRRIDGGLYPVARRRQHRTGPLRIPAACHRPHEVERLVHRGLQSLRLWTVPETQHRPRRPLPERDMTGNDQVRPLRERTGRKVRVDSAQRLPPCLVDNQRNAGRVRRPGECGDVRHRPAPAG